ncbi:hypothetical protein AB1K54_09755 [Microbacterium sp. BWT-B31]|uniref:hypothetical protein n=1 Tax=Microbacterium sp. BWT-B31 TaxID=3232072 RepID=UPI003527C80F
MTGDAVHGQHCRFRAGLEARGLSHVFAVPSRQIVIAETSMSITGGEYRADAVIQALPKTARRARSAGQG